MGSETLMTMVSGSVRTSTPDGTTMSDTSACSPGMRPSMSSSTCSGTFRASAMTVRVVSSCV